MISTPVVLAFTAGMVAAFNPCGFSLLPAYIGAFVSGDDTGASVERRVLRAILVASAVSIGFVVVFASAGLFITHLAGGVRRQLPWVTIGVGTALVVAGISMVAGWKPTLAVRVPRLGRADGGLVSMVGYGITYAVASLSCTIGPFLAVTGTALTRSTLQGVATYVSYSLGMGVVVLGISVASALAHSAVFRNLRRFSASVPRIGGVLLALAGGYAIWYGRWELSVYGGEFGADPVVDMIEGIRLDVVETIESIGAGRLSALVVVAIVMAIVTARTGRSMEDKRAMDEAHGSSTDR
jgi:cytochrome c biogenesis protein CcdA